ncbi:hypothetical protein ACFQDZ_16010 [Sulfitobacter pacificus]|uniref:hypothetical protein n=1 Tax=Sulfitobacter pacificus TaxID=1499314 RepID=UPI00360B13B1
MIPITPAVTETPPTETIVARLRSNAVAHPDRLALVCGDTSVTWGHLTDASTGLPTCCWHRGCARATMWR